jgi:hypothetical protein
MTAILGRPAQVAGVSARIKLSGVNDWALQAM